MRQIFRRNTSPSPTPTPVATQDPVIGFGIGNTIEKLKRGPGFRFRERDRVKVIAPPQFAHKMGYIVETHDLENEQGLMEVELDQQLNDDDGYEKITDTKNAHQRITIKNPARQLIPYKYMKCDHQHFATSLRADALIQMSTIATYILCADIISVFIATNNGISQWNNSPLFISYLICCSLSLGLGFYVILMLSFIGTAIKRISGDNSLMQLGSAHDVCNSHFWVRSTQWKPWWLCGRADVSCIDFVCDKTAKAMVAFIGTFMVSIVLYLADHIEWYLTALCMIFIVTPSLLAFHVIKNRGMMSF